MVVNTDFLSYGEDDPRSQASQVHYKFARRLAARGNGHMPAKQDPPRKEVRVDDDNREYHPANLAVGCF